jgi:hypothetical protein
MIIERFLKGSNEKTEQNNKNVKGVFWRLKYVVFRPKFVHDDALLRFHVSWVHPVLNWLEGSHRVILRDGMLC